MAAPVLVEYFKSKKISDLTIVSPDVGNMKTAARYAAALGGDLAIIHKKRISGSEVECGEIIGDVEGRNVLMCDDMISTAGTMCSAAELVKERGASSIIVGATHGVFAGNAVEKLNAAPFDEVIVTDTIPQTKSGEIENMKVLTIAKLLGEAIKRTHRNKSISSMFDQGY
jgi:ribose-phosphate pyrophosphokinase